jgi:hypothetical protein
MAAIPIGISYAMKESPAAAKPAAENSAPGSTSAQSAGQAKPKEEVHLGALLGELLLMGLASPFMEFTTNFGSAAIGLFILFIGLRIVWAMTAAKALHVDGPFSASAP